MFEQFLTQIGLKEGVFAGLFIWLLYRQMKQSEIREEKLYSFLDGMKAEFAKLVGSYEQLSNDVAEIREDLDSQRTLNSQKRKDDTDEKSIRQ
jgi:hypothetical protein